MLCAALLHDTLEDTQTTLVERRERFGEEVAGPADWPLARKREYFEWAKAVANRMRGTLPVRPQPARHVGTDPMNGRYAEVTVRRCTASQQLWLRYFVEYASPVRALRWARAGRRGHRGRARPGGGHRVHRSGTLAHPGRLLLGGGTHGGEGTLRWEV